MESLIPSQLDDVLLPQGNLREFFITIIDPKAAVNHLLFGGIFAILRKI